MSLVNEDMKCWSCSSLLHMSGKRCREDAGVRCWPATVDYQWNINSGFQELWHCDSRMREGVNDAKIGESPFSDSINFILHLRIFGKL